MGGLLSQEISNDGSCSTPVLFFTRATASPPLESSGTGPWELPGDLLDLQHTVHQFKTVSFNSWKVDSSNARIKKEFSILFSVNTVVTSQDIVVGFDCAN